MCPSDAQLGCLQWGEIAECEAAYSLTSQSADDNCSAAICVFLCVAGGSSLLVWKFKRLRDHPAHHGGEQAVACHHALSCAGRACAGSCPAGLSSKAKPASCVKNQPQNLSIGSNFT